MNVVTRAMITSIVKRAREMSPRSRPMFSTISSVRPRVFMRTPTTVESRRLRPQYLAAAIAPCHFPVIATAISRSVSSHRIGRFSAWTCVRSPVTTKKSGSRTVTTKSSSRRLMSSVRTLSS